MAESKRENLPCDAISTDMGAIKRKLASIPMSDAVTAKPAVSVSDTQSIFAKYLGKGAATPSSRAAPSIAADNYENEGTDRVRQSQVKVDNRSVKSPGSDPVAPHSITILEDASGQTIAEQG